MVTTQGPANKNRQAEEQHRQKQQVEVSAAGGTNGAPCPGSPASTAEFCAGRGSPAFPPAPALQVPVPTVLKREPNKAMTNQPATSTSTATPASQAYAVPAPQQVTWEGDDAGALDGGLELVDDLMDALWFMIDDGEDVQSDDDRSSAFSCADSALPSTGVVGGEFDIKFSEIESASGMPHCA